MKESSQAKAVRAAALAGMLKETYPEAHCELRHKNAFELLVATILSAQCTDKQVNKVTSALFQKYSHPKEIAAAALADLEQDLKSIGMFRSKAKNIKSACDLLVRQHKSVVPDTMEALVALDGVGRKTANVVLGNAFGKNEGVVVDTHVARLSKLLGLTSEKDPAKIEKDLMNLFPREQWTVLSHWLIWHGRRRCSARKPDCGECQIRSLCPSAQETS
jgi:endonuclease-3